jgi:hypothetical protein
MSFLMINDIHYNTEHICKIQKVSTTQIMFHWAWLDPAGGTKRETITLTLADETERNATFMKICTISSPLGEMIPP